MSRIPPRVQRTSFDSAAGGNWKCMPRRVAAFILDAILPCAITGFRPYVLNSFRQKARAKKPRESSLRSRSIIKAPLSLVSEKITVPAPARPTLAASWRQRHPRGVDDLHVQFSY